MDIKYIDVHSHIHFPEFAVDREAVLERMREAGIATITIGVDLESSKEAIAFAEKHDGVYAAIGGHPHDTFGFVFKIQSSFTYFNSFGIYINPVCVTM